MGRRTELMMDYRAIANEWDIPPETKQAIIKRMTDIVTGATPASAREKIRAAECLAKIDSLNIAREGQEKTSKMDIQVLPPAYREMPEGANVQMVEYLQRSALPAPDEGEAAHPEDGERADQ